MTVPRPLLAVAAGLGLILLRPAALYADILYVDPECPASLPPFDSWDNAATNIQNAFDWAADGDTVIVTDGTYVVGSALHPTAAVTVASVNGPAATRIQAVSNRCLVLSAPATLDGFTFTNGYFNSAPAHGAGLYAPATGVVVRNCRFENNYAGANSQGGGLWLGPSGSVDNCVFSGNRAIEGGGVFFNAGGIISGSSFSANTAQTNGGGLHADFTNAVVSNCVFTGNSAADYGGGLQAGGRIADCTFVSNVAGYYGGGLYGPAPGPFVDRCRFLGNVCSNDGGGLWVTTGGRIRNSLIAGNSAGDQGGGVRLNAGLLENCTVVSNSGPAGGGFYSSSATSVNCVIYFNTPADYSNRNASSAYAYTCTVPEIAGDGNFTNDPAFLLAPAGDYHLATNSPCRDAGTNLAWMAGATDLDGHPRTLASAPDLGAFEFGPLVAAFQAVPATGVAPVTTTFHAAVSGTNAAPAWFRWDFENDAASDAEGLALADATNTYAAGVYSVRLEVSNDVGEVAVVVKTNWITAQDGVAADFTADVHTGAAPFVVQFTDLSANTPQFWAWDFENDGTVDSTDPNPQWTFTTTGQFTVALTASNDFGGGNGSADTAVKTNFIHVPALHLVADFTVAPTNALIGEILQFTDASANGPTHWTWYFRNVGGGDSFEQNPTSHYTSAGYKTVKLVVSNEWSTATAIKTNHVRITGTSLVHYVSTNGADIAPFTNWATASRYIADALAEADVFDTVLVSNGTYEVPFLGLSCAGVTLISVNGPADTVIDGGGAENILKASSLREEPTLIAGFTLTNGYTSGDGAGLWITRNVTASNCVVTGCRAGGDGAGILLSGGGLVTHCDIRGNTAEGAGGGIKISTTGTVLHSRVAGNIAYNSGGGVHAYSTNSPDSIEIGFCRILDNQAAGIENGGGVYLWHGRIHDSLLVSNSAYAGGGLYGNFATVRHCTLAGNSATNGGGLYVSGSEVRNCIAWDNTRSNLFLGGAGNTIETCDILPAPTGAGNRDTDPLFRDPGNGDFYLKYSSGAIDSGSATELGRDLDGIPRPLDGDFDSAPAPDMGAFEYDPETADSNGDGIPDWWYHAYALDPLDPAAAAGHADADPFDNGSEWTALTDPTSADSRFVILAIDAGPGVHFDSRTNRLYRFQRCTNLPGGAWSELPAVPARLGAGGADAFTDTDPPPAAAYRLQVQIPASN